MLFGTICRLTDHFEEVYFTFQCFICSLKGRERAIISQTNIGTVSKGTLGKLLRDGMSTCGLFQVHRYTISNWTKLGFWVFFTIRSKHCPLNLFQVHRYTISNWTKLGFWVFFTIRSKHCPLNLFWVHCYTISNWTELFVLFFSQIKALPFELWLLWALQPLGPK